mgnify:FL=1|jgi:hypothetical protein
MSCLSLLVALSLHIGLEGNYNNVHPHARCDIDNTITGAYYNSEENISFYVGKKIPIYNAELEVGLVTGYSGANIAPMIRVTKDSWFVAPAYETTGNIGFVIGYEFKLD